MSEYDRIKVKVKVEQRHIDGAKSFEDPGYCPVAMALRELFPGQRVVVGWTTASVGFDVYHMPLFVFSWIGRGMDREKVEPFEFTMERN